MPLFIHDVIQFIKGLKKGSGLTVLCDACSKAISGDIDKYNSPDATGYIKHYCSEECKAKNPVSYNQ